MPITLVLTLVALSQVSASGDGPRLWAGLEAGAHGVGYRLIDSVDGSRSFGGERSLEAGSARRRPVRISVWHPAVAGGGEVMQFSDYVARPGEDVAVTARRLPSASPVLGGASAESALALMGVEVAARRNAVAADGSFPVVLAVGRPDLQPSLCEYLASHGFVVASVEAIGPRGPRRGAPGPEDYEACARDLEFALGRLQELPFVDGDRVALLGFGGGGLFALPVVTRNSQVDAFVGYDAGVFMPAFSASLEAAPGFDRGRFDVPFLHLIREETSFEEAPELIDTAPLSRTIVVTLHAAELQHHDLSQAGVISTEVLGLRQELKQAVRTAHHVRALCTLRFLQSALLDRAEARAWLESLEGGEVFDPDEVSTFSL